MGGRVFMLGMVKRIMGWRSRTLRERKVKRFYELMQPAPTDVILDVGFCAETEEVVASDEFWQGNVNPLAQWAPWPVKTIGLSFEELELSPGDHANMQFVQADGRQMPFKTGAVDFVFSNAVIEHVGTREDQRRFVEECLRVAARGVFITTPNRHFLLDPHVGLPFVHYLPERLFAWVANRIGHPELSSIEYLNALSSDDMEACFPAGTDYRIEGVGMKPVPEILVAWSKHDRPNAVPEQRVESLEVGG